MAVVFFCFAIKSSLDRLCRCWHVRMNILCIHSCDGRVLTLATMMTVVVVVVCFWVAAVSILLHRAIVSNDTNDTCVQFGRFARLFSLIAFAQRPNRMLQQRVVMLHSLKTLTLSRRIEIRHTAMIYRWLHANRFSCAFCLFRICDSQSNARIIFWSLFVLNWKICYSYELWFRVLFGSSTIFYFLFFSGIFGNVNVIFC